MGVTRMECDPRCSPGTVRGRNAAGQEEWAPMRFRGETGDSSGKFTQDKVVQPDALIGAYPSKGTTVRWRDAYKLRTGHEL